MAFRPLPPPPVRDELQGPGRITHHWERWFENIRQLLLKVEYYSVTIDAASVAANTSAEQTFTVTGLQTGSVVTVTKPSLSAGLGIVNARCSAENTVAITFMNATGSAIDPSSETYLIAAIRG
jgi:hypothetical protein